MIKLTLRRIWWLAIELRFERMRRNIPQALDGFAAQGLAASSGQSVAGEGESIGQIAGGQVVGADVELAQWAARTMPVALLAPSGLPGR
jgi:hypothetical protein